MERGTMLPAIVGNIDRFMRHVEITDDCWLWRGAAHERGYGRVRWDGRIRPAHRVSHEVWVGPVDDHELVLHDCDVPACVNPDHLRLGTHRQNAQDRVERGRIPTRVPPSLEVAERWLATARRHRAILGRRVSFLRSWIDAEREGNSLPTQTRNEGQTFHGR